MPPSRNKSWEPSFLSSWKEIANYMGKGVRTVQRYEAQFGFPVRRPAGKPRGSVIATCAEIDAWIAASPIRRTYSLTRAVHSDSELMAIRSGLKQMHILREQMATLRAQADASLALLIQGVQSLRAMSAGERMKSDRLPDHVLHATDNFPRLVRKVLH